MRGGLQAGGVRAADELCVVGGVVVELTGAAGVADVAFGEVCGPAAERAVGVELDAGGCELRVAEGRGEPQVDHLVEQVREEIHRDAHALLAGVGEAQVGLEFAFGDLCVADRGDASCEELALDELHLTLVLGRLIAEVEVRSVVADLDPLQTREDVACGIRQLAGQLAVGILEELAALGVRGLLGDAVHLEGVGVHHAAVAGGVHDVYLAVRRDLVELEPRGVAALGEVALLVAEPAQRHTGGELLSRRAHEFDDLGDRCRLLGRDVDPGQQLPVHERVGVCVDESGDDRGVLVVDALGSEPGIRRGLFDLGEGSHSENRPPMCQHRLCDRPSFVDRADARGGDDQGLRVAGVERCELTHQGVPLFRVW